MEAAGLYDLAGLTRGTVLQVVGSGENAFPASLPGARGLLPPRAGARGGRPRRPEARGQAEGREAERHRPGPRPAEHPHGRACARGAPRRGAALAAPGPRPADPRHGVRAAGRRHRKGAPADRGAGGPGDAAPDRRLRAVERGREGGGESGLLGHNGGRRRVGGLHRRGRRRAEHLQPAPRSGGRLGPARQRRPHGEGGRRLGRGGLEVSDLVLARASGGRAVRPAVDLELEGGGLSAFLSSWARGTRPGSPAPESRSNWLTRRTAPPSCG